jgi:hypothetical protein
MGLKRLVLPVETLAWGTVINASRRALAELVNIDEMWIGRHRDEAGTGPGRTALIGSA